MRKELIEIWCFCSSILLLIFQDLFSTEIRHSGKNWIMSVGPSSFVFTTSIIFKPFFMQAYFLFPPPFFLWKRKKKKREAMFQVSITVREAMVFQTSRTAWLNLGSSSQFAKHLTLLMKNNKGNPAIISYSNNKGQSLCEDGII